MNYLRHCRPRFRATGERERERQRGGGRTAVVLLLWVQPTGSWRPWGLTNKVKGGERIRGICRRKSKSRGGRRAGKEEGVKGTPALLRCGEESAPSAGRLAARGARAREIESSTPPSPSLARSALVPHTRNAEELTTARHRVSVTPTDWQRRGRTYPNGKWRRGARVVLFIRYA